MRIGIIGAGNVGPALGKASVRAGHQVTISDADASEAQRASEAAGAVAAASNRDAVADAEIVILAVPFATTRSPSFGSLSTVSTRQTA